MPELVHLRADRLAVARCGAFGGRLEPRTVFQRLRPDTLPSWLTICPACAQLLGEPL